MTEQFTDADVARVMSGLGAISENGCGIPGHAVAVGCGSSAMARAILDGAAVSRCPSGRRIWAEDERGVLASSPCESCHAYGWLRDGNPPDMASPPGGDE